jgi:hypothetical protein
MKMESTENFVLGFVELTTAGTIESTKSDDIHLNDSQVFDATPKL